MEFFEVVRSRHSIRAFTAKPVEAEKLHAILEAADRAPSAGNLQAYEIYVVTHRTILNALARAALDQEFIAQAPLALVFCAHPALLGEKVWSARCNALLHSGCDDCMRLCTARGDGAWPGECLGWCI